ncbi:MAG: hypothetical protein JXR91_16005 [Deltaproteobacteria bacterium]|nr:hypothetical protein [Deltaproteobacteria bacterium]
MNKNLSRYKKNMVVAAIVSLMFIFPVFTNAAQTSKQYETSFKIMLDYAIRINEYVKVNLHDKRLAAYANAMAETNARQAEQMSPPKKFAEMHPHFLLILENIERSFYYASKGQIDKYRNHQKIVRKELGIIEIMADRAGIEPYDYKF